MPWPVQIQRLARELQKRLGIQGFLSLTLVEDLQPVIQLLEGPEGLVLRGEELRAARLLQVAGVGVLSRVALVNPVGSTRLAVVERVVQEQTVSGQAEWGIEPAAFASGVTGRPRDLRISYTVAAPPTTALFVASDNPAAFTDLSLVRWRQAASTSREVLEPNIVVPPGQQLSVYTVDPNVGLEVSFWWRDWAVAPQELVVQ